MNSLKFQLSLCILILFAAFTFSGSAQVDTEAYRKYSLEPGLFNTMALNLGYNSGNTNFIKIKAAYRADYYAGDFYSFLIGNLEYKEGNEELITNKGFVHLRLIYNAAELFHPELFLQKEFNKFILLKDRNLAGAGARLHLINVNPVADSLSKINFYLGIGAMYEEETYSSEPFASTSLLRSTNYVNFIWEIDKRTEFNIVTYFQVNVARFKDFRILCNTGLKFKIIEKLKFIVNMSLRFDNEPIWGVKKYDFELNNGISFEF